MEQTQEPAAAMQDLTMTADGATDMTPPIPRTLPMLHQACWQLGTEAPAILQKLLQTD